ncbi:MAG: helix-turn-helix domain-containing protein [Bacillota bacterium]|nr:helix-turn-helix domain-containing protein [Bacillota bacterium]
MRDLGISQRGSGNRALPTAPSRAGTSEHQARPLEVDAGFSHILTAVMGELGLTQYRLVQLSGLGADTICRLAQGTRNPTETQVLRIGIALGMNRAQISILLDIAGFYPFPPLGDYRPTGMKGWPGQAVAARSISARQKAFYGNSRQHA